MRRNANHELCTTSGTMTVTRISHARGLILPGDSGKTKGRLTTTSAPFTLRARLQSVPAINSLDGRVEPACFDA